MSLQKVSVLGWCSTKTRPSHLFFLELLFPASIKITMLQWETGLWVLAFALQMKKKITQQKNPMHFENYQDNYDKNIPHITST